MISNKKTNHNLSDSEQLIVSQFNDFLSKEQAKFEITNRKKTLSQEKVSDSTLSKRQKIFEENLSNVKKNLKTDSIINRKKHKHIVWYKRLVGWFFGLDYTKPVMPKTKTMVSNLSRTERYKYRLLAWIQKK